MKKFTAIIFDLDGVIIDTEPLHERTKRMAFDQYGVTAPDDSYAGFIGRSDEDMVKGIIEQLGSRSLEWRDVLARKHELFNEMESEIELIPGATEFIAASRKHFDKLALVTSATRRNQQYALRRFGLESSFDVIVTAEDIARTKPDPEPYLAALAKLALPADTCLVIEDSTHGVASAKAAGCAVVAITTSFTAEQLGNVGPHYIVSSYTELRSLLDF